jgi:hypothetical protein
MLVKTGDAEIIDVVDPNKTEDDEQRKSALDEAMDLAKKRLAPIKPDEVEKRTERS